ncbi:unnamed protein product [Nesidiocoris tenuis]|uniref:Uncharacterized protein n=1 Tax=Nesidiocoris tenuis TaxID=355587 RepID=A0A6H5G084_9HEMI|nr:unnamed protein product [Nesidiocoris tenuis]
MDWRGGVSPEVLQPPCRIFVNVQMNPCKGLIHTRVYMVVVSRQLCSCGTWAEQHLLTRSAFVACRAAGRDLQNRSAATCVRLESCKVVSIQPVFIITGQPISRLYRTSIYENKNLTMTHNCMGDENQKVLQKNSESVLQKFCSDMHSWTTLGLVANDAKPCVGMNNFMSKFNIHQIIRLIDSNFLGVVSNWTQRTPSPNRPYEFDAYNPLPNHLEDPTNISDAEKILQILLRGSFSRRYQQISSAHLMERTAIPTVSVDKFGVSFASIRSIRLFCCIGVFQSWTMMGVRNVGGIMSLGSVLRCDDWQMILSVVPPPSQSSRRGQRIFLSPLAPMIRRKWAILDRIFSPPCGKFEICEKDINVIHLEGRNLCSSGPVRTSGSVDGAPTGAKFRRWSDDSGEARGGRLGFHTIAAPYSSGGRSDGLGALMGQSWPSRGEGKPANSTANLQSPSGAAFSSAAAAAGRRPALFHHASSCQAS